VTSLPDLAVRAARANFNRALAEAKLDAIGPLLAPDAILITGTDSAILTGRKAQLLAWKREFSAPAKTLYARIPETITVSPVEPIALEVGHWHAVAEATGEPVASGRYTAKWRTFGTQWRIEAEIYVTLA